jgi:hypothetical protein
MEPPHATKKQVAVRGGGGGGNSRYAAHAAGSGFFHYCCFFFNGKHKGNSSLNTHWLLLHIVSALLLCLALSCLTD